VSIVCKLAPLGLIASVMSLLSKNSHLVAAAA
jgi:hypothetical protein